MLIIRAFLLFLVVAFNVIGATAFLSRYTRGPLSWSLFFVGPIALVVVLSFVEHVLALPSLLWLLPVTTLLACVGIYGAIPRWGEFALPSGIFLGAYSISLGLRCLHPDITTTRDGITDLSLIASFCDGQTLPPICTWFPPYPLNHYYAGVHYAASVVTRLLGVDIGTGFNLTSSLIAASTCLCTSGIAWILSHRSVVVTLLAAFLVECAQTGSSAYLWLTTKPFVGENTTRLCATLELPHDFNVLWKLVQPRDYYDECELMVPGSWQWFGSCHSTCGGQLLTLIAVLALLEIVRRSHSTWSWMFLLLIPLLICVTSTWGFPIVALLAIVGLFLAWRMKIRPPEPRYLFLGLALALVLLLPTLADFLTTPTGPDGAWTQPAEHVQPFEFLLQWWPVYIPWLLLLTRWRGHDPVIHAVLVLVPLILVCVEFITVGVRIDMTGKYWCYTYAIAWSVFFPLIAVRRDVLDRATTVLLLITGAMSLVGWTQSTLRMVPWDQRDCWHLEGTGPFRYDFTLSRLLQVMGSMRDKVVLVGKSDWAYDGGPPLANFTDNRIYVTWSQIAGTVFCGRAHAESNFREKQVDDFYNGKCSDPLLFLRSHDISAVVIWPDDNISASVLAKLRIQLEGYYDYEPCDQRSQHNAGIFLRNPYADVLPATQWSLIP